MLYKLMSNNPVRIIICSGGVLCVKKLGNKPSKECNNRVFLPTNPPSYCRTMEAINPEKNKKMNNNNNNGANHADS